MNISIIIPTYNGKGLLEKHLEAVIGALKFWEDHEKGQGKGEIIVIDDASTDGTAEWLKRDFQKVRIVRNLQNLRFAQSCNRGMQTATGDVVILLNNDVKPHPEFLVPLLKHFSDTNVFAVGCREINRSGEKELIGGRGVMAFRRGLVAHWRPKDQESHDASWVSAGSAAYRREAWLKLGGFDRLFRPAYEEDRDLCWQALKAGYKLVFEPKAPVWHDHETTNRSVFGSWMIELYSMKNQLLFVWKNLSCLYLLFHLLWLPYHLFLTTIRTRGIFLVSFFLAVVQLPEVLTSRRRASRHWKRSDEEVLSIATS